MHSWYSPFVYIQLKDELSSQSHLSVEEADKRLQGLEQQLTDSNETVSKSHQEVDRLLTILKEMENEKHEKDSQIKELQEFVLFNIYFIHFRFRFSWSM